MKSLYLIMFLANTSVGLSLLFIPVLTTAYGISFFDLGLIGTAYGLASFFSYALFGRLSDIMGKRKYFIQIGLAVSCTAFFLQLLMRDLGTMLMMRGFAGFSLGIFSFPMLAYVSKLSGHREKVAWYAGFGSLGWFTGYFIGGVASDPSLAFLLSGVLLLIGFALSFSLREVGHSKVQVMPFVDIVKRNFTVYLTYFLRQMGAQAIWIIFPIFLIGLGANIFWVGVIQGLNTLCQFFVIVWLGKKSSSRDDEKLIRIGLVLSSMVFVLYYFTPDFVQWVPVYLFLIPVQILLAFGWGTIYVGSLLHLIEHNKEKATSTGLLGSTISLSMVAGPLVGGAISQVFGMRAVMLFAAGLTLASIFCSRRIKK